MYLPLSYCGDDRSQLELTKDFTQRQMHIDNSINHIVFDKHFKFARGMIHRNRLCMGINEPTRVDTECKVALKL